MITYFGFVFQGKYIAECIDEIKQELRQENQAVKANAVNKLIYVSSVSILTGQFNKLIYDNFLREKKYGKGKGW